MSESFRAFVVADAHVGNHLPHSVAGPDGVTDRLIDQLDALEWCFDQADQRDLPLVCLGDLFDDHLVDTITLDLVGDMISKRSPARGFYVVPGNHDAHDQSNRHFSPGALSRLTDGVMVLDDLHAVKPQKRLAGRDLISALPFCRPVVAKTFTQEKADERRLLLAHLEINGFGHGGAWACTGGVNEDDLKGWGAVLSGHFHTQQEFKRIKGMYVGALCQLKFDDVRKPQGGWVIEWDGSGLNVEFITYPDAPTFRVAEFRVDELRELLRGPQIVENDCFYRCTFLKMIVTGTDDELVKVPWDKLRQVATELGVRRLVFDNRSVPGVEKHRLDVEVNAALEDILTAYVKHPAVLTNGMDRARLLDIGVQALRTAREGRRQKAVPVADGAQS